MILISLYVFECMFALFENKFILFRFTSIKTLYNVYVPLPDCIFPKFAFAYGKFS